MTRSRQALGAFGERYAAAYLARVGYRIVARNVRLPSGEIDIVAEDGDTLAFVEVRTRRGDRFGSPEESVTRAKAQRLIDLGHQYLQAHDTASRAWRIDVLALSVDRQGKVSRAALIKNAIGQGDQ